MSVNQHSPGIEWVMFRLGAGERPVSQGWGEGSHCVCPTKWRNPGDYVGRRRIENAPVGSLVVVPFLYGAPAQLVELTTAVSA